MFAILRKIIAPKPQCTSSGIFESEKGRERLEQLLQELFQDDHLNKPWNKKKEKLDSERQWSYSETYSRQCNDITYSICFSYGEFYGFDTIHGFEGYTFTVSDENNAVLGWAANNNRNGTMIKDFYYAVRRKYHQNGLSLTESDEGLLSFADLGKLSL